MSARSLAAMHEIDVASCGQRHGSESLFNLLFRDDVALAVSVFRRGDLTAAELGEYVAYLIGLCNARELELRDNAAWSLAGHIIYARDRARGR